MDFGWLWCVDVGVSIMAGMGERLGVGMELEIDMYTLLYLKQRANQDLLYSMGAWLYIL